MDDLIESLMRDNPAEVKTVLATVTLALAVYQLVLITFAYRGNAATGKAHRASGDTIAILPVFGTTVFGLLALTWATSAPEVRGSASCSRPCSSRW